MTSHTNDLSFNQISSTRPEFPDYLNQNYQKFLSAQEQQKFLAANQENGQNLKIDDRNEASTSYNMLPIQDTSQFQHYMSGVSIKASINEYLIFGKCLKSEQEIITARKFRKLNSLLYEKIQFTGKNWQNLTVQETLEVAFMYIHYVCIKLDRVLDKVRDCDICSESNVT